MAPDRKSQTLLVAFTSMSKVDLLVAECTFAVVGNCMYKI